MPGSDFLHLDPSTAPARGRTNWLVDRLRRAMADGTLAPDARLPATRVLAEDLSVARGTVVEAYRRLAEEGLVVTNRGGGTVVAATLTSPTVGDGAPGEASGRPLLNISAGAPDLSAFPRAAWLRAERQVLATATERELGYADPQGAPELRRALAHWLARSRGVAVQPERIIVTAGVTGALSLLCQGAPGARRRPMRRRGPGRDGQSPHPGALARRAPPRARR